MNWLSNFARPGLSKKKPEEARETPDNLWIKDPLSGDLIYRAELEAADWVTPSGFHMRIGPEARFKIMFDDQAWQKIALPKVTPDPLKFKDDKKYVDRLKGARAKVGREDTMEAGYGRIGGAHAVVLVQDFEFMGGSLGMAAGEAFIAAAEAAVRRKAAMVMVTSSGGARMQEGILSLMQMPRTTLAIQMLREAGLPYLVVLADPTTGGVTASYAMLGDVHIAEPGALIGFAGPRVIEQTIRQKLPEGFQRSEYLLDKGMVDMVVDRRKLKTTVATLLSVLMHKRAAVQGDSGETTDFVEATVEELPKGKRKQPKQAAPPTAKAAE
ncbi:MAG: acetyl-CoA carboxylase carboxyltransferase subunit beta [Hyphomonadaceae bacterium]|jgi:acetyl-CoA carboxylase carboxyl transferase subunit beta|nr:acetyl-CoA carboxylase carboxyltransferase subunit beta [Hyphomonadaceae bacterium]